MKLIENKEQFSNTATEFLELLFAGAILEWICSSVIH